MSRQVRPQAARVVAAVLGGRSLKAALPPAEAGIADPRDRALLHAIVFASLRGALRWQAILNQLLQRPLPARARLAHAALMTALAQIEQLGLPEHAVVDETVATLRHLGQPQLAGLGNAVLRRWLRERDTLWPQIEQSNDSARTLHPPWLLQQLRTDWPLDWPDIVQTGNTEPALWLRVNASKISVADYRQRLQEEGIAAEIEPSLPQALRLDGPVPISRLPGFADGLVSIQDGAAQYAAALLAPEPGQHVLDACAAPGGKTAHLLETTPNLAVLALDREPDRLRLVTQNLNRLGLTATLRSGDAGQPSGWWSGESFDRILLDAPCSATGIVRRQPDVRLHRQASDIPVLAAQQHHLLRALWPLLAPGGRLVYAVCSVLRAESEAVLMRFLADTPDARTLPVPIAQACPMAAGVQLLPGRAGMDGFAYALLAKNH